MCREGENGLANVVNAVLTNGNLAIRDGPGQFLDVRRGHHANMVHRVAVPVDDVDDGRDGVARTRSRQRNVVHVERPSEVELSGNGGDLIVHREKSEVCEHGAGRCSLRQAMVKRGEFQEERRDIFGALQHVPIRFEDLAVVCTWEAVSAVERDERWLPTMDARVVSDGSADTPPIIVGGRDTCGESASEFASGRP